MIFQDEVAGTLLDECMTDLNLVITRADPGCVNLHAAIQPATHTYIHAPNPPICA